MISDFNSLVGYLVLVDVLVTALLFVLFEGHQRRKQARLGKRRSPWLIGLFATLIAPFIVLQIAFVGCLVVLQSSIRSNNSSMDAQLLTWLPAALVVVLVGALVPAILSMRRAGR